MAGRVSLYVVSNQYDISPISVSWSQSPPSQLPANNHCLRRHTVAHTRIQLSIVTVLVLFVVVQR